jgi:hypothetical protein
MEILQRSLLEVTQAGMSIMFLLRSSVQVFTDADLRQLSTGKDIPGSGKWLLSNKITQDSE